jgi:hypothetical protein
MGALHVDASLADWVKQVQVDPTALVTPPPRRAATSATPPAAAGRPEEGPEGSAVCRLTAPQVAAELAAPPKADARAASPPLTARRLRLLLASHPVTLTLADGSTMLSDDGQ